MHLVSATSSHGCCYHYTYITPYCMTLLHHFTVLPCTTTAQYHLTVHLIIPRQCALRLLLCGYDGAMIGFKTEVTHVSAAHRFECKLHWQVRPSSQSNDPIRNGHCPNHIDPDKGSRQCKKRFYLEGPKPQLAAEKKTVQLGLCVCQYLIQHVCQ